MSGLERKSEAVEPGTVVPIQTASTAVLDAEALDEAYKVILVNNSAEDITLRLAEDGAVEGEGIVLKANGGSWDEDRYAGAMCAIHHGASGTADLSLVII